MKNHNFLELPNVQTHRRKSTASSDITSKENRWSDVVPANSALTFAVIWDPEDEIAVFSGADLFEGRANGVSSPDSPSDACDNYSQVLTIGPHSTIPQSENTATLAFFRDHHDFFYASHTTLTLDQFKLGHTRTSSTLEGLDVYLRGSMFIKNHLRDRQYSFLGDLDKDFKFDPRTSFANRWFAETILEKDDSSVSDEGFFESMSPGTLVPENEDEANLSSAFSVTTTSTSNYISVELDDESDSGSDTWSTLEAPNTPSYSRLLFSDQSQRSSKRLKKRRPTTLDDPASPTEVLRRPSYNHATPLSSMTAVPSSPTSEPSRRRTKCKVLPDLKMVRGLSLKRWKSQSNGNKEAWICVDVETIQQTI